MADDGDAEHSEMKEPKSLSGPFKYIYHAVFVLSAVLNVVFSIITYQQKSKLSELEIEKRTIENRALAADRLPSLTIFRLIYEINTLDKFLRSGDQPPFLNGNKVYRIVDDQAYTAVKSDLDAIQKRNRVSSRVTFLAIANLHDATAYAVTATGDAGTAYRLGDLEGHSAILIPLIYEKAAKSLTIGADDINKIAYREEAESTQEEREVIVPPRANLTWTPVLNDSSVVGRAAAAQPDDDRLNELLPKP